MIFRNQFSCRCNIKKQDFYSFDITDEEREEGMKRTFENPLLIKKDIHRTYSLHAEKGKLQLTWYHSYDSFEEGFGNHKIKDSANDWLRCTCGELFRSSKTISAKDRFNKHTDKIKQLKKTSEVKK